jgi:hypothetical protein
VAARRGRLAGPCRRQEWGAVDARQGLASVPLLIIDWSPLAWSPDRTLAQAPPLRPTHANMLHPQSLDATSLRKNAMSVKGKLTGGDLGAHQKNEDTFLHFSFELIVGVGRRLVRGAGVGRRGRRDELARSERRPLAPFLLVTSAGYCAGSPCMACIWRPPRQHPSSRLQRSCME